MGLEEFIIKRIREAAKWGWIVSLDGDVVDVMVPEDEKLQKAEEGLLFLIEVFTTEFRQSPRPVKYYIWNKQGKLSGISDPKQKTEMIGLNEAIRNGEEWNHNYRKANGQERKSMIEMLPDSALIAENTVLNHRYEAIYFLAEGYLIEYIEHPHETEIVGFFASPCIVIPMSPSNALKVTGDDAEMASLSTKHLFSMLRRFEECRGLYKEFKKRNFARTDKYFAGLKNQLPAERYAELIAEHPWVTTHVDPSDIASYLRISVEEYYKMQELN